MIKSVGKLAAAATLASAFTAGAAVIDFEGIPDWAPVGGTYAPIASFSPNATAIVDSDLGGSGDQAGNPLPDPGTVMVFYPSGPGVMDVPGGFFTGSFSVWYANPGLEGAYIELHAGLGGTGPVTGIVPLAPNDAPSTAYWEPWDLASATPFFPVSSSAVFIGTGDGDYVAFDNVSFEPFEEGHGNGEVPEPSTVVGAIALGALALSRAIRRR